MTAFITHCCRRLAEILFLLCLSVSSAFAGEIGLRELQLVRADDGGFTLAADFDLDFSQRLEEAVGKGLTLSFVAEFELMRPRWYWLDERVVKVSSTWRLTYHALTRQYRLSTGLLHQSFTSLAEALRVLSRLRNWQVVEGGRVHPGETFIAALRVYLDVSQLPKPFQVEAISNKDWVLSSAWKRWSFTVPPVASTSGAATAASGGEPK